MSTIQTAIEFAKNYPIFPCSPDKNPLVRGGFKTASQAPAQITAWWRQFPNALIGIPTGHASGLLVVDIDRKNGHDGLATLRTNGWSIPLTRIQQTTSGGQHVFFQYPADRHIRCSAGVLGDGVDIRAEGGYVICWEAEGLPLLCEEPPAPLPDWLQTALAQPTPARGPTTFPAGTGLENPAKIRSALASLDPDMSYPDWVQVGMALHHSTGGGTDGLALWNNWSAQGSKYRPGETAKKWESFGKPGGTPVTLATVYKMATVKGWRWKDPSAKSLTIVTPPPEANPQEAALIRQIEELAALSELEYQRQRRRVAQELDFGVQALDVAVKAQRKKEKHSQAPPKPRYSDDWASHLLYSKEGEIKDCPSNLIEIFDKHPEWSGRLRKNLFTGNAEMDGEALTDNVGATAAHWCGITLRMTVKGLNNVFAALHLVASKHPYHPVVEYLDSLQWDGTGRIDNWLADYFGVGRTPYTMAVAAKVLLSAVARVYEPACKVDTVLTMIGSQGIGKSAAWRILASAAWFSDSIADMHSKDAMQHLRGKWIVELAELSAMQRSELEAVKRFISCSDDSYRPSYGRHDQAFPRQCIFVATTNLRCPLKDTTGNRRWWPVEVTQELDMTALQAARDQLWAEAVTQYKAGEPWRLDNGIEVQAAVEQHGRVEEDDWQEKIMEWLGSRQETTHIPVLDIYQEILGLKVTDMTLLAQRRVAGIMRQLGWTRKTMRHPITRQPCGGFAKDLSTEENLRRIREAAGYPS